MSVFEVFLVGIQSKCEKIRIRKTPHTDTFHAVTQFYFQQKPLLEILNSACCLQNSRLDQTWIRKLTIDLQAFNCAKVKNENTRRKYEISSFFWYFCNWFWTSIEPTGMYYRLRNEHGKTRAIPRSVCVHGLLQEVLLKDVLIFQNPIKLR